MAATYTKSLETVNPRKATPNFYRLYVNFAKFYEEGGTTGGAEFDTASARKIFEKATKVPFKTVEDLAEIWCEWSEMEIRAECVNSSIILLECLLITIRNYDEAIRVMQRATAIPREPKKINYHDQVSITIIRSAFHKLTFDYSHFRFKRGCSNH